MLLKQKAVIRPVVFGAALLSLAAFAQTVTSRRQFEVVSTRPVAELTPQERMSAPQSRVARQTPVELRMPYASMQDLLERAFGVSPAQLEAPAWIGAQHYSLDAKTPARDGPG